MTDITKRVAQVRELANTVALQAEHLATNALPDEMWALIRLIKNNVETLEALTKDWSPADIAIGKHHRSKDE